VLQTAATNVPRFDHNPTTGESLGLLVEEQRTNLLLNSGTLSTQSVTVTAAAHTLSFTGTGTITLTGTSTAGPLVGTGESNRVSLTFMPTAGSLTLTVSGTVTNAQLEVGSFRTSYIPTTAAAATRSADVASITGSNFSSWYRQDEGTVFYDGQVSGSESGTKNLLGLSNGSGSNIIDLVIPSKLNQRFRVTTGGVQQALQNVIPTASVYNPAKVAYAFKLDDTNSAGNGTVLSTDTSCTIPTVDRFTFGVVATGEAQVAARFKRLTYWPQRLANSTLQNITT